MGQRTVHLEGHDHRVTSLSCRSTERSNSFASCEGPEALHGICDRLGAGTIRVLFARWMARLPLDNQTVTLATGGGDASG